MKTALISTYELGRQPFGLASPAAWLRARGHEVRCADLSVSPLPRASIAEAGLVAFYLPMHTAARLAAPAIERVRESNPGAHLAAYGLYAPLNESLLRKAGVATIIGGEFEAALADLADSLAVRRYSEPRSLVPLDRLRFLPPDREGLPGLHRYAKLRTGGGERTVGYTEASRGCKHLCRHCPVVPVYQGAFRIVQPEVVLEDVRRQVEAGAGHITFGDPDFFNGPTHALRIVEELHRQFPALTYDATIKIEHLLARRDALGTLRETGCLFVTSAVESLDDEVLAKLDKGHTRAGFLEAVALCRAADLLLAPTFIAFTPWTTRESYRALLGAIAELDLIDQVSPIQLALRLLIPNGSRLLELEEVRRLTEAFDEKALVWRWRHEDPSMDESARRVIRLVNQEQRAGRSRREIFWAIAQEAGASLPDSPPLLARAAIPYLNEPWYC
ncbi:MAG: radical SAM protein [Acidobacteria bacterium]|nr:radical SAM protein [Acidobacteriota bacterium]